MKKSNKVVCPVCGRHTFSKRNDYDICKYCGWENDDCYDGEGANELSLDAFKIRYEETLRKNSGFIWRNDGYDE